jgi:spore coat protein A
MLVDWANELPKEHFLPIDHSLHGAEVDKPEVRSVIHLHGAKVPAEGDGYPENWYVPGKSAVYYYPNEQDAALLWYHDHALGINRLNVFAGLLGLCIVRDPVEDALNLPRGKHEIPLVLYDRMFDQAGQLCYPVAAPPRSPWVPEFFGNAVLANGKIFPFLEVEPRKYRFRTLNGANSRFLRLSLSSGQTFHQIGTDQGLLPAPVRLQLVLLAPAERADLVLDFSDHAGEQVVLNNGVVPVMQFKVARAKSADTSSLPPALRPVPRIAETEAVKTRTLTLGELDDTKGDPVNMLLNNSHWNMPVTENPALNSDRRFAPHSPSPGAVPDFGPSPLRRLRLSEPGHSQVPRRSDSARSQRGRLERHGAGRSWDDYSHHRALRRLRGPLCMALPHSGARGQ